MDEGSIEYVNGLIDELRNNNKKAEFKLWERYFPRIEMYAKKNSWCRQLKSPEDAPFRLWETLKKKFLKPGFYILRGEGTVVYNVVRGYCRDWVQRERREPSIEDKPPMSRRAKNDLRWSSVLKTLHEPLSECLAELTPAMLELIDLKFFENLSYQKISKKLDVKKEIIIHQCEKAFLSLEACLNNKGIFSMKELEWIAKSSRKTSTNIF